MCSRKESTELFSGQEIGKARMLQSEESPENLLEISGGRENEEEETSVKKVGKGVREDSGNSREILKRKGVDFFAEI